jgi:hypothetical protein
MKPDSKLGGAIWRRAIYVCREAEFIGKIRLLGVKLPPSISASAAFFKI